MVDTLLQSLGKNLLKGGRVEKLFYCPARKEKLNHVTVCETDILVPRSPVQCERTLFPAPFCKLSREEKRSIQWDVHIDLSINSGSSTPTSNSDKCHCRQFTVSVHVVNIQCDFLINFLHVELCPDYAFSFYYYELYELGHGRVTAVLFFTYSRLKMKLEHHKRTL